MTPGWTLFITIVTALNIVGALWLLYATSRPSPDDRPGAETGHTWDGDLREYHNPLPRWWLWLFYGTVAFSVGYLVLYPGLGSYTGTLDWTQQGQWQRQVEAADKATAPLYARFAHMSMDELIADADARRVARNLFANNCAVCHGSDARGAAGFPNLTDSDWLWGGDEVNVQTSIGQGRVGAMPPWGPQLGPEGVEEAVAYVLTLSGRQAPADLAAAGKARFDLFCVACHGPEGKGNQALGAPNLTDPVWLHGGTPEAIRATIVNGRNNPMPAQQEALGARKVRLLASYVLSLSPRVPDPAAPPAVAPVPAEAAAAAAADTAPTQGDAAAP
jgi:cytochrome c oxidase cbb3-type subunit III